MTPDPHPIDQARCDPTPGDPAAVDAWAVALDDLAAPAAPDAGIEIDRAVARRLVLLPRVAVPAGVWSTLAHAQAQLRARQRKTIRRWAAAAAIACVLCGGSLRELLDTEPQGGWPALAGMTTVPVGAGSDARLSEDLAIAYGLDND